MLVAELVQLRERSADGATSPKEVLQKVMDKCAALHLGFASRMLHDPRCVEVW